MELIREFSRIGKDDADIAGGKGASLGEMTQAGIPVPPGYVVLSASFERFLEETDLNVEIDAILATVSQDQMHTVEHASEHIQKLILEATMPEDIKTEVMSAFDVLDTEFVAVRSSATAEDSASAAWAGQLDTYLNTTRDMLLEKVQECWASLFTPRAIFYRFEKGLDTHKISVAVVVQKMVNSDAAGIAFSVHPVTEDRNQLIIEAGFGLGEAVVSGQITPDSYVVTKEPRVIIDKNVSEQAQGLFRKEGGGNEWRNTGNGHEQVLSDDQILALSETLVGIEKHYGFPVDTEWAMEGAEIFITQSRPITTLSDIVNDESVGGEEKWQVLARDYNSYYLRSHIWTIGIGRPGDIVPELEGLPHALAMRSRKGEIDYLYRPLAWKQMHEVLVSLLEKDITRLREFIHITNDYAEAAVQRGKEIYDADLSQKTDTELFGYFNELASLQMGIYSRGVLLPLLDFDEQSFIEKRVRDFLAERVPAEKIDEYFLAITAPSEESFALQQEKDLLLLASTCDEDDSLRSVVTAGTVDDALEAIRNDHASFYASLEAHTLKHRWVYYSYAGPAFTPKEFLGLIRDILANDTLSPREKLAKIVSERKDDAERKEKIIAELAPDAFYTELLSVAGTFVWAKPTRKDYQSHLYFYLIDGVLVEIARRLGVSMLQALSSPFEMLEAGLKSKAIDTAILDSIYDQHVVIPEGEDVKLYFGDSLPEITKTIQEEERKDYAGLEELAGTMACGGTASGIVRIINKPEDMQKMQQGDILVSVATTPSIVPAMQKAAAFITDEGGITCHAAIVAREMKKPCIIGTKIATQVLRDGDTVSIDANKGIVRIIERAEPPDFNSAPSVPAAGGAVVLSKVYGREKPLFYFALWQADDKKGIKEYLNEDLTHDLFIVPPPGVSGSIWYSNEEFERLAMLALEKVNESDEFAEALVAHIRRYWELLVPYLVEKKRCSTADEMYAYYQNLVEFWMPMNSVFFTLPDRPGINPIFKEGILAVREITQEYTEEMPRVFSDFFAMRFPEIAHLGYYATPEETVQLDRELEPELLAELERRAKDGCFMFESSIYPLAMLDTVLSEHGVALEKIEVEGMTRLTGQIAYKGNATGPVCLILSKADAKKMKKGDILVTPMTNPDLVPIMKLAAAIVTDEGGLTCHAAIASRELKVSCVVGTKIATTILKDGDMVEVDANNGIVTILKASGLIFKKMFTRDTTIIMQELWGSCLTKGIEERFGIDNPNRPAIVHYMNEGSIEIWENSKANAWLMDAILERNNEAPNEFADVIRRLSDQFDSLAEDWENGHAKDVESLQANIQKARSTLVDFIPYYYSAYDDRTPEPIKKQALTLREKDVFFSSSDTYIRKSLLNLYPHLNGMESAVCIDEITAPPSESVLVERMRHMTLIDGVECRTETLEGLSGRLSAVFQAESIARTGATLVGQSAYKGIVKGPVRILRRLAQLGEVQEGDILVSPMTTPDFMPAMIKAAAFVTDEGGVTCHAGIVARELKKPCVIGTKFATQILRDGDQVEVDADNGIVRIIDSAPHE